MSFVCGHFEKRERDGLVGYVGNVSIRGLNGDVALAPVDKYSEGSPDYLVKVRESGHGWEEMGGGWAHPMKKGGTLINICVDGPHLPEPIRLTAFPVDGDQQGEKLEVKWSRPSKKDKKGSDKDVGVGKEDEPF
ncbi:DUF736 family protein [Magnetococcus sp. PR-3]|uniref:DUF736 family protein n=1 Tax=Magnetococcus sp. PR-3 TaxID=3120355 RepID=UPI002FCDE44F